MKIGDVELDWLGHAGFVIKNSVVIYIDPYNIPEGLEKADVVLITHSHYDHCSFGDLQKIVKEGTRIIAPADCQSKVARFEVPVKIEVVESGSDLSFGDVGISVISSYNVGKNFHCKDEGWVGYLVKIEDVLIYHAGDCDVIPEMQKLTGYKQKGKEFVALLPIGGKFTMNVEDAVEAAKMIKPSLVVPMHYGSVVGSKKDAEEFKVLCGEEGLNCKLMEVWKG